MTVPSPALNNQRGIALLMVLWTLMLLAVLVVAFTQQTRLERQRIGNVVHTAAANSAVEAGLALGIGALLNPARAPGWTHDGTPHDLQFGSSRLSISIQDANGCLDLNKAEVDKLQAVLRAIGVEGDTARSIAAAIADWRDSDNLVTPNGAEMQAYVESGVAGRPANRSFLSVGELQGVLGMTPEIAAKLSPLLTVFTAAAEVNAMTAPEPLLRAIVPEEDVPAILARRAARRSNASPSESAVPASSLGTSDLRSATQADLAEVAEGPLYVIDVTASSTGGGAARGRAVVWLTEDGKRPYQILDWQSIPPASSSGAPVL